VAKDTLEMKPIKGYRTLNSPTCNVSGEENKRRNSGFCITSLREFESGMPRCSVLAPRI